MNKWLQHSKMSLHVVSLIKTFLHPILIDGNKDMSEDNCRPFEEAILCLSGKDLQKHLKDCIEHSLLTERELKAAKETMLLYVKQFHCP